MERGSHHSCEAVALRSQDNDGMRRGRLSLPFLCCWSEIVSRDCIELRCFLQRVTINISFMISFRLISVVSLTTTSQVDPNPSTTVMSSHSMALLLSLASVSAGAPACQHPAT